MTVREIFRQNLRYYRKLQGLTQEALSEKLGLNPKYITNLEAQSKFPSAETIDAISSALKIKPSQLFEEEGCPHNYVSFDKNLFTEKIVEELSSQMKSALKELLEKKL